MQVQVAVAAVLACGSGLAFVLARRPRQRRPKGAAFSDASDRPFVHATADGDHLPPICEGGGCQARPQLEHPLLDQGWVLLGPGQGGNSTQWHYVKTHAQLQAMAAALSKVGTM